MKKYKDDDRFLKSAKLLALYMYPCVKLETWDFEILNDCYRFQMKNYGDCGYHILNFMKAAVEDTKINNDSIEFADFKKGIAQNYKIRKL